MMPVTQEIQRFRDQIAILLGLYLDEPRLSILAQVLHKRSLAHGTDQSHYLNWLETRPDDEIKLLARELTVTETYFLRNIGQFNAFVEVALPERLSARGGNGKINVLSAGCSSGEEPYSLAIMVRERCPYAIGNAAISALDLNPAMLQKAELARYSSWSLRDLSEDMQRRWFKSDGDAFVLNDSIKKMVTFESRNLTRDDSNFWVSGKFDIVFCRNILMYFSDEQTRLALHRITQAMAPGGYLFLGHAETLRGLSNDFHLCHSHDTFYYQRKQQITDVRPDVSRQPTSRLQPGPERWQPGILSTDTSWAATIQRASENIQTLHNPAAKLADNPIPVPVIDTMAPAPDLQCILDSLQCEKYRHASDQIENLPARFLHDPDVLLLKAIALSFSGALAAAELVCEELLSCDELNAGAHYVLALCREGAGDMEAAAGHDQTAAYLAPGFAMPRLHLGLLARRQNERDQARAHLEQAASLLQQEDAARIALFGGGFKREALLALCNAELATLEGIQ